MGNAWGAPAEMETVRQKLTAALPDYDHIWDGEIDGTLSVYIGDGVLGAAVQVDGLDLKQGPRRGGNLADAPALHQVFQGVPGPSASTSATASWARRCRCSTNFS